MKCSLFSLAGLASTALGARFALHVPNTQLVNPSTLPSSTHAILQSSGPPQEAYLTRSNSFNFYNVSAGSYLVTIHSRDALFEPLRIDVSLEEAVEGSGDKKEVIKSWQTFIGNEWDNKGESRGEGGNGVVLEARLLGKKYYFQERSGFSPLSFLKNPMMLMALFSMVLIFGMPKLMENMDPETRAEFEEMQKQSPLASGGAANPAQAMQNFDLASWMAGKTDTSNSRGHSPAPQGKKRG
ncbi:hypothetical protein BU24DRAFT_422767 [Aaosphaeria arxii CBS 175.79]|uniref:ER membrane protein complex subunit 7 beta-sandwich domain-containing protein n=1 Tax=Aaosphaeria arxii CBS 175.79 TaxID=1450172 RepID=A0A6A5XU37_9PLEO|nr:uncharacterized protein BU24DRAFT_422767 [Aaosphaeria arxii CBS 175.79]KAF2016429.1 hypothetical protein BU24DRAFT_422767 [Aaosphaeria arxii CBS 175.79]